MKKKWMGKLAMLLAVTLFMTQVSYFPAKAAEVSVERFDEAETELEVLTERDTEPEQTAGTDEEPEQMAGTDTEPEQPIGTDVEPEQATVVESEAAAETETTIAAEEKTETEAVTETVPESSIGTETEPITEIGTESESVAETEVIEEQLGESDTSLSGISFELFDVRDSEETNAKLLNTDDGKQAVYVFGSFTTCYNTAAAVRALSKCVTYYDKNKISMFVIDIGYVDSQDLASWLDSNKISEDVVVGSILSSSREKNFYETCADKTVGYGSFTMPIIVYRGTDGAIYTHTTGYQTESAICTNIEAGGLNKSTGSEEEPVGEKEGLLYVSSGLKYSMAYEILDLVNAEREKEGLPALVMDKDLLDAAMQRAVECEVYYASDHTRPNGQRCFTASTKMNGENIAWGYGSAAQVMNAWMSSEGHKANILRAEFHSIGIGVADTGGGLAFTQCFGVGKAETLQKPSDVASKTFEVRYIKSRVAPSLTQSSVNLTPGETYSVAIRTLNAPVSYYLDKIMANSYTWKSSDETVAAVDEFGKVTGIKAGKATVTGTNVLNKEHTLTLEVTVEGNLPNVSSITLNETSLQLKENETFLLVATVTADAGNVKVSWSSSDETVAAVSENGLVTAKSEGAAVITATCYGKSATCNVRVEGIQEPLKTYTVTFDTDGGSSVDPVIVYENHTADKPKEPTKAGYRFAGWYLNGMPYDFSTPVTEDITLKAVWIEYDVLPAPFASLKSEMVLEQGTRVALLHAMSNVTIYYTTDGSMPTETSTEYKNAIIVNQEITIRAIAVKDGYKNSEAASFHYTVAEKGSLWGDVSPEDVPDSGEIPKGIWVTGIQDTVYTGKAVTHNLRVYDGSTLLIEKKDYTVSYKNNVKAAKKTDAKAPTVVITGKGNYNAKKSITFNINPKDIGDDDVTADEIALAYTGKAKKVVPVITYLQKKLVNNRDFTIQNLSEYKEAKEYVIQAEGKGNYTGKKDITLTITQKTLISKASVTKIPNQTYDGKNKTPEITVKLKKKLELNKDYTLSYENNREIGTASVIIKGMGEYAGTKRVTFKIVSPYKGGKYDINKDEENLIDVDIDSETTFMKGGSTPAVRVSFNGKRLVQGKDYTVSFKGNKTASAVSGKDATAIITGKGSYCGKITRNYRILAKDISETILLVNDKGYTGKAKGHITKFTLTDMDGMVMRAGTDYEREVSYTYAYDTNLGNGENRAAGESVKDTDIIPVGTTLNITVKGKGSYTNSIMGEYRIIAKENDISKAKITLKTPQYYTGSAVEPDENQFEVKLGQKILQTDDYKIIGYTNNVKKGSATVTIRGEGEYGGTKTAKFTIGSRPVETKESK